MRDQKSSNRDSGLTAPPRIGSGDLLGVRLLALCKRREPRTEL